MQPLDCHYCRRTFHKADHLKRHELSHTKSRPYTCSVCHRAFARQDSLTRHKRLHDRPATNQDSSPSRDGGPVQPSLINHSAASPSSPSPLPFAGSFSPSASTVGNGTLPDPNLCQRSLHGSPPSDLIWPDSEDFFQSMFLASDDLQHNSNAFDYPSPVSTLSGRGRFGDQAPSIEVIPENSSTHVVHHLSNLIRRRSSNLTSEIDLSNLSSRFLDECLHMFFVKFIPVFPVLHRPTFVFRDCLQPLLLSAMAIGSLYLGHVDAVNRGQQLWKLAHIAISTLWKDMISHQGPHDERPGAQLLITSFLSQIYGVLSKDSTIRSTSQAFFALGFTWAKQCRLLTRKNGIEPVPPLDGPEEQKIKYWHRWIAHNIQQRAVLAHYALDGLLARSTGQIPTARHLANDLPLQWDENIFAAQSANEFVLAVQLSTPPNIPVSFRTVLSYLLSPGPNEEIPAIMGSSFNLLIIQEGLQAVISDCITGIGPDTIQLSRALMRMHDIIGSSNVLSKNEKLEATLRWHTISLEVVVDTSKLGLAICQLKHIKQNVWTEDDENESQIDVSRWSQSFDGRRALLHAVAIQEIIEELPRGRAHAIHMPSALLSAAMVCIAFCLSGMATVNLPNNVHWAGVILQPSMAPCTDLIDEDSSTRRFIAGEFDSGRLIYGVHRNLAYECNSMQKLFGCLATQWGVAAEMGAVLRQCAGFFHAHVSS